jgi:microcystin-dependent protein
MVMSFLLSTGEVEMKIFKVILAAFLLAGTAFAQPGPPSNLNVGVTPVLNGTNGNCLSITGAKLAQTPCVPSSLIDPAHGGTGTSTVFTTGSIPFAGASGIYQQNNPNFFWSQPNLRLGIGTNVPALTLHVNGSGGVNDGIQMDSTAIPAININNTSGGASQNGRLQFQKSGNPKFDIGIDSGATGAQNFYIRDSNLGTDRIVIDSTGNFGIGTALAPGSKLTVQGPATINSSTAITAGGSSGNGVLVSSTANFGTFFGSGAPTISAARGSIYLRSDGPPYYNVDGATTWASLASGSGTVNGGTINQLAWYAGTGSTVSGLATANSSVLVTSGGGVPSLGTTLPNGITGTTQAALDNSTKLATTAYSDGAVSAGLALAVPIGVCLPYGGSSAPNSQWLLAYGQAINRTTYAGAFAIYGVAFGSGDGSTTFNLPDLRGRVAAGLDNMGGSAASRLTSTTMSPNGTTMAASGGAQTNTATTTVNSSGNNTINSSGANTISVSGVAGAGGGGYLGGTVTFSNGVGSTLNQDVSLGVTATGGNTINVTSGSVTISVSGTGTSSAFSNVQPTLLFNYICKVQ